MAYISNTFDITSQALLTQYWLRCS